MKRLLIIVLVLFSLASFSQTLPGHFPSITSPYDYQWLRARYLRLPVNVTVSNPDTGAIRYYIPTGKAQVWTGLAWQDIGGTSVDSFTYATRARLYNALDSLVSSQPTPNLQAVTDAGNTTTNTLYAGGFVTGNYKALLYEGGGSGWLDLKDEADNVTVKARGAGSGGRGEVTTEAIEFPTNLPAPPNEYNAGSWYVYRRADTLRAFKDGVEYNLIGGGGSGSTSPTLSTITYSAAPKFDYAVHGTHAKITLTGNASLGFLNLPAHVEYFTLEVIQDATGGRTLSIPASVQILGGNAGYSLSTTGGAVDILTFYWNGSTLYMNYGKDYKY